MRRRLMPLSLILLMAVASETLAIDHKNWDENRPLRLEDAYSIASGELAVEAGAGFALERRGPDRGFSPVEVLYGAYPNLQLGLGTTLFTDPHDIDEQTKSGDLQVSGLYNLNQETLTLPAFGVKLELNLPTGVDSAGVDVEVKGLVTKSFDRLSLYLNAGYEFLSGTTRDERHGRYEVTLGASYPVGAPQYTRTTLIGDVFTEPGGRRGGSNAVGTEVGFRHQLTARVVLDAALGTEFAGPADRSPFFVTTGLSEGF
jgi:outer membrane putative beta-barrel porin/alpha-amylase